MRRYALFVITGLDPVIQVSMCRVPTNLDCRVKPGNDEGRCESYGFGNFFFKSATCSGVK